VRAELATRIAVAEAAENLIKKPFSTAAELGGMEPKNSLVAAFVSPQRVQVFCVTLLSVLSQVGQF
jgi:hypothetical protein